MIVELEKLTVKCLLERTFEKYGSLPSIAFFEEQPIVYLQLKQQVQETATALVARNIKKGDCVLFLGADLPLSYPGAPPSRPDGDGLDPDYRLDYLGFRLVCVSAPS